MKHSTLFFLLFLAACQADKLVVKGLPTKTPMTQALVADCQVKFAAVDSPSEIAQKAYRMSEECKLSEEQIVGQL